MDYCRQLGSAIKFWIVITVVLTVLPSITVMAQAAPEIQLSLATSVGVIPDNSITFQRATINIPIITILRVRNVGAGILTLSGITATNGCTTSGILVPDNLAPATDRFLTIRCPGSASLGQFQTNIDIVNNDSDENPYNIILAWTVEPPPELAVFDSDGLTEIPDNSGTINIGTTTVGVSLSKTFIIRNIGTGFWQWSSMNSTGNFMLTQFPPVRLEAGNQGSLTVACNDAFSATGPGRFTGTVNIFSNEADENPYNFTVTCTVTGTLALSPAMLPDGVVGTGYSQVITASGGVTPYTYAVISGSLPAGLNLNTTTGELSGIPTTQGNFSFTIEATDDTATTVSQTYSIRITQTPTIISNPAPPPVNRCVDENFIPDSSVRARIPDEFKNDLRCRIMVQDGQFLTLGSGTLYHWGNIGNRQLVDMGVIGAVDVFNTVDLRQFHDAVICLRGTGRVFLLNDTYSEAPRAPVETITYTVPGWPGFTCVTLSSPATVVLVYSESAPVANTTTADPSRDISNQISLTDCRVYLRYSLRLRQQPDQTSAILANVPFDQTLRAVAMVPGWYRVRYGKHEGWLSMQYLTLYGQCEAK